MDINELRTFVEVANAGGISPGAQRLGLSKSIVSRRLLRLEADLGVQLLARSTRGAALTQAGAMFREHAARACAEIDMARESIRPAGELKGRLRIAAPLSFGPPHFAAVLAEMARRHPQLQIQTCYSDHIMDLIAEGFDCAIRLGLLQDSNMVARRVGPFYATVVASPDYIKAHGAPETPEELLSHQALMQGTESWILSDGPKAITVNPRGRFKADNGAALVAAALVGLGIAYLPNGLIQEHLKSGALVPVMTRHPAPPGATYVVRPPGSHPERKIGALTDLLIEYFNTIPVVTAPPHS